MVTASGGLLCFIYPVSSFKNVFSLSLFETFFFGEAVVVILTKKIFCCYFSKGKNLIRKFLSEDTCI